MARNLKVGERVRLYHGSLVWLAHIERIASDYAYLVGDNCPDSLRGKSFHFNQLRRIKPKPKPAEPRRVWISWPRAEYLDRENALIHLEKPEHGIVAYETHEFIEVLKPSRSGAP